MALVFSGGDSDRVVVTDAASIQDLSAFTVGLWVRWAANTNSRGLYGKAKAGVPGKNFQTRFNDGNKLNLIIDRATTDAEARSNDVTAGNTQHYIVGTYDESDGPRIFHGTLTDIAAELTYAVRTVGVGSTNADATANVTIGNTREANNDSWNGAISYFFLINRRLALGEIQSLQFRPRPIDGTVIFMALGYTGTSTQPDWSGNGNHGTVTGAVVESHVPVVWRRVGSIYTPHVVAAAGGNRQRYNLPLLGVT